MTGWPVQKHGGSENGARFFSSPDRRNEESSLRRSFPVQASALCKHDVPFPRVVGIVKESRYRGYLPIETLGPGVPRKQVPRFLAEVRRALASG